LTKCTYIVKIAADMGALAFKLDQADFSKFQMHYVEWADSEMKFLPAVSASPGYFGTYTANTFPMPLFGTYPAGANAATKQSWNFNGGQNNWNPNNYIPGSIGPFTYYPYYTGPYQLSQTLTIDTGVLFQQFADQKAYNDAYLT